MICVQVCPLPYSCLNDRLFYSGFARLFNAVNFNVKRSNCSCLSLSVHSQIFSREVGPVRVSGCPGCSPAFRLKKPRPSAEISKYRWWMENKTKLNKVSLWDISIFILSELVDECSFMLFLPLRSTIMATHICHICLFLFCLYSI